MTELDLGSLDVGVEAERLLRRHGFDLETFSRLREELARGAFPVSRNAVTERVAPLAEGDLAPLPPPGSEQARELEALGTEALRQGHVAAVVLNGGMATRFGGVVKGVVEVFDGMSFIALKLEDAARAPGRVPVLLMCSFATEADTLAHLEQHRCFGLDPASVHAFTQRISIRLTPEAEIFRDAAGRASLYAPGHGDLFESLAGAPGFARFVAGGGRLVVVSNVDNVGATLSPRVIGAHLASGREVTVEVAARARGDRGGAPARVGDRVEVLESFRFPPDFDIERLPVFNTNTMVLDVGVVRPDFPLTWFRADKSVDGRPAVQFERLMGQVTAFRDTSYLVVPRGGPEGRFLPVKTPDDLVELRPMLRERTGR